MGEGQDTRGDEGFRPEAEPGQAEGRRDQGEGPERILTANARMEAYLAETNREFKKLFGVELPVRKGDPPPAVTPEAEGWMRAFCRGDFEWNEESRRVFGLVLGSAIRFPTTWGETLRRIACEERPDARAEWFRILSERN